MSIADDPEDCLECGRPGLPVAVLISSTAALCPDCAARVGYHLAEAWQICQLAGLPSLDALRISVRPR